jgi:hypothetical protein
MPKTVQELEGDSSKNRHSRESGNPSPAREERRKIQKKEPLSDIGYNTINGFLFCNDHFTSPIGDGSPFSRG